MSTAELPDPETGKEAPRRPRMAFMGEFSAGKSTLSNLLLGSDPLPVKVTATQLPPVWLAYGEPCAFREDLEGNLEPLDLENLESVVPEETRVIRIHMKADILELCDLIDMPGISDPNMSPELWQRVIDKADLVVWCTHATQAWRQSEAAVWASLDTALHGSSVLLLTRFDKLLTEHDRNRVLKRVRRETEGLFADCFPVSLTMAAAAEEDPELWEQSGAEPFMTRLLQLLDEVTERLQTPEEIAPDEAKAPEDIAANSPVTEAEEAAELPEAALRVVPRRVVLEDPDHRRSIRPARGTRKSVFGGA